MFKTLTAALIIVIIAVSPSGHLQLSLITKSERSRLRVLAFPSTPPFDAMLAHDTYVTFFSCDFPVNRSQCRAALCELKGH